MESLKGETVRIASGIIGSLVLLILGTQCSWAGDMHNPPWPLHMSGVPVDASGDVVQLPACWRFSYYVPIYPHGAGLYVTETDLVPAYTPFADCFMHGAVLQWPDDRIPVPMAWRNLPQVGDQPVSLYCSPTGKNFIANPATGAVLGPLYQCEWPNQRTE